MSDAGPRAGLPPGALPGAALTETLCAAINAALALDDEAEVLLAPLAGTRIEVVVDGFGKTSVRLASGRVWAEPALAEAEVAPEPDLRVRGGVVEFARFGLSLAQRLPGAAAAPDPELPPGLRFEGDVAVAQRLMRALARIRPDWEAPLARVLGDVAGHEVARTIAGAGRGLAALASQLSGDLAEYLRDEAQVAIGGGEYEQFADAVDETRDAVARLEARLRRAEKRLRRDG